MELIGGWGVIFSRWSERGELFVGGVIRGWGVIRGNTVFKSIIFRARLAALIGDALICGTLQYLL